MEVRVSEHQQQITGAQADVAELAGDRLAGPVDGDHGSAVAGAKTRFLESRIHERRPLAYNDLVEGTAGMLAYRLEVSMRGRHKPRHLLQVEDSRHVSAKRQPIPGLQNLLGRDRRDGPVVPLDLDEEDTLQLPQPRVSDRSTHQRAGLEHLHLHGEAPHLLFDRLSGAMPDLQQSWR